MNYDCQQQNIINCGFGADNQSFKPAQTSVLFDRKVPRNPHLINSNRSQFKKL